jgi:hypothetical protein
VQKPRIGRRLLASFCCFTLLFGCGPKKEKESAQKQVAEPNEGWPREVTKNGARLTYYQPQIDSWTDSRQLDGPRTRGTHSRQRTERSWDDHSADTASLPSRE